MMNRAVQNTAAFVALITLSVAFAVTGYSSEAEPGPTDSGAPMSFTTTASGLKYRILRKSDGKKPKASDRVTVHYKGWLDNKTEFDSSYKRGKTIAFPLSGVIGGWTEGLQLVGEGGMIELEIPSNLGYGESGAGNVIPPNATLHFLIELKKIN
jgi:FKBP-type peptidyl-prolyl cis-trans isomerase FkpA